MTDEFKKDYQQGREDTKEQLKSIRRGEGMTDDYSFKIAKPSCYLSIFLGIGSFFYVWLVIKWNFFISLIVGFIGAWIFLAILIFVVAGFFKLASKSERYK